MRWAEREESLRSNKDTLTYNAISGGFNKSCSYFVVLTLRTFSPGKWTLYKTHNFAYTFRGTADSQNPPIAVQVFLLKIKILEIGCKN